MMPGSIYILGLPGNKGGRINPQWNFWNNECYSAVFCISDWKKWNTLESGINVAPWINVTLGKFGKKNKRSPIFTLYLYNLNRLYEVRNKTIAPRKKSKN